MVDLLLKEILGLYWDNGKYNGNYYNIRRNIGVIQRGRIHYIMSYMYRDSRICPIKTPLSFEKFKP